MSIEPGTYRLGPQVATLSVRTGRRGAVAKAGHDLLIEVSAWGATVEIAAELRQSVFELEADPNSLQVRDGTGGFSGLAMLSLLHLVAGAALATTRDATPTVALLDPS